LDFGSGCAPANRRCTCRTLSTVRSTTWPDFQGSGRTLLRLRALPTPYLLILCRRVDSVRQGIDMPHISCHMDTSTNKLKWRSRLNQNGVSIHSFQRRRRRYNTIAYRDSTTQDRPTYRHSRVKSRRIVSTSSSSGRIDCNSILILPTASF
jgi:hypothetical protein